jgi:NhaP-type Na+/H+ or K+/H+ antiporter
MVNDSLVFYGLLPPMLFADGYNLKKRRFFQNLYYINIYGLVGTVLHFLVFVGLLYAVSALGTKIPFIQG